MSSADDLAFERIRDVGRAARAEIGAADVWLATRLKLSTGMAELAGRAILLFGDGPLAFAAGLFALAYHFSVEAQLNHSVMHGAYAGLRGAAHLDPARYETLAIPFQSRTWGTVHAIHHKSPSLLGDDPDTVHPLIRVHRDDPWRPWHVFNAIVGFVFVFECWAIDYDRFLKATGRRAPTDRSELAKLAAYVGYNYLLFPLLAGERWMSVALACVLATVLRNFIFAALQTGSSVGRKVSTRHDRAHGDKRRGAWLRFQVETSKNFVLQGIWKTLCGGLDRHIEHHLYPDLPPNRLYEVTDPVRDACAGANIDYQEFPSVWSSLADSVGQLRDMSKRTAR